MSHNQNSISCHIMCWIVAGLIGLIAMFMLYLLADFGFLQAFFSGAVVGALIGVILSIFVCSGQSAAADLASDEKPAQRYAAKAAAEKAQRASAAADAQAQTAPVATAASSTTAAATSTAAPLMAAELKPSAPLAGQAELASRKGSWKYEGDAPAAEKPAAKKAAAKKPAAKKAAVKEPAAKKAPAKKAAAKPAAKPAAKRAPVAADGQPQIYSSAPAGGADDLKLISGVGPKLEQTLNDMGIYLFEQVAGWRKKEIAWVDDRLKFKGRIERDDWMSQAKILAKGGETEFSKRAKK